MGRKRPSTRSNPVASPISGAPPREVAPATPSSASLAPVQAVACSVDSASTTLVVAIGGGLSPQPNSMAATPSPPPLPSSTLSGVSDVRKDGALCGGYVGAGVDRLEIVGDVPSTVANTDGGIFDV